MGHKYAAIAFTDDVKKVQQEQSSRDAYSGMDQGEDFNYLLSQREADFIGARDSFYMASVSETDWPYVQHRGGPVGFMCVLDEKTLGFADFSGNRQYISTGNFRNNDRVAIIFMDYPNRTRMKLLGRVSVVAEDDLETISRLEVNDYRARVERGFLIHIEAFDWNCPQHITPRYSEEHIQKVIEPLEEEIRLLKQSNGEPQQTSAAETKLSHLPQLEQSDDDSLELVISGIRQLTPRVRAFELRHPANEDLPEVNAGSHLQIPVQLENGGSDIRHYSICSNPARRDIYEIAVLREEAGKGGSKSIHQQFQLGMRLICKPPENHFELHKNDSPAVLIAGGIGITPIKAMAQALKSRAVDLTIQYAGRDRKEMAFRDRLQREFAEHIFIYSSSDNERMDIPYILSNAPADSIIYICGPNRLIDAVSEEALRQNIHPDRIRFERFAATLSEAAKPFTVNLQRSNIKLEVSHEQTILDALLDAGVDTPYGCKVGNCKSCAVKVLDGEPEHHDSALTNIEKTKYQLMCPCVSRATSAHLTLDL